mmetsp:Transcript_116662/g.212268  ORF Transcript_116662/g.212268 Transcript_116662/m.212268 type:complete len:99 (+) Transcript_116662:1269-1565(+)
MPPLQECSLCPLKLRFVSTWPTGAAAEPIGGAATNEAFRLDDVFGVPFEWPTKDALAAPLLLASGAGLDLKPLGKLRMAEAGGLAALTMRGPVVLLCD